jgi:outer membrane beta-barrel protein
MIKLKNSSRGIGVGIGIFLTVASSAIAAPPPARQANPSAPQTPEAVKPGISDADEAGTLPERIDVQSMKRRYWTVGNEDLMDVVQNRRYTKKGRVETALRYGNWSDDAFQDQKSIGLSVGYHLNEFLSLHGFYTSISASNSQAYRAAIDATGGLLLPTVNPGKSAMGVEARGSLIYGKLSLLGSKIIYYDLNTAVGLSQHKTADGQSSMGYFLGLGQQFFLNKSLFLTLDYRMLFHTDSFRPPTNPSITSRSVTTNWLQFGLGFYLF